MWVTIASFFAGPNFFLISEAHLDTLKVTI